MKQLLIVGMIFFTIALTPIPNFATQSDYFYIEIECPEDNSPICSLQNSFPFKMLNDGIIGFYDCDRNSEGLSCEAELTATGENGAVSGRLVWTNNGGSFALGKGSGMLHSLQAEGIINGLSNSAYILEGTYRVGQNGTSLTHIPSDPKAVLWMQAHGNVKHGGGNTFFHDGIDFGVIGGRKFFSAGDGEVTVVELNTGQGWPGTNYRITIQVTDSMNLDYHFEIGGYTPLKRRKANIFVSVGEKVKAGQHIGNLILGNNPKAADVAHVHWGIYNGHQKNCPLNYFTPLAAKNLEALYDSGIEKRPRYRKNLCE